jgi:hypothetical protein
MGKPIFRIEQIESLSKSDVGLDQVDNTSDANKPISTAAQTALDTKQPNLSSGTNIKSINGQSILGSGNLNVGGEAQLQELTADYTAVLADAGKVFYNTSSTDYTFTIPNNTNVAYGPNVAFTFIQFGTGKIKIDKESGVTADTNESVDQNVPFSVIKLSTDNWAYIGSSGSFVAYVINNNLYQAGDAADPVNETNTVDAGWTDQSGSDISFSSVANDTDGYVVRGIISSANAARAQYVVSLEAGVVYDYVIRGRASAASKIRIIDPQRTDGAEYAAINSQPYMTTSFATYNLTLSPTVTGTYNLWFDFNGETSGDWFEIDLISLTPQ